MWPRVPAAALSFSLYLGSNSKLRLQLWEIKFILGLKAPALFCCLAISRVQPGVGERGTKSDEVPNTSEELCCLLLPLLFIHPEEILFAEMGTRRTEMAIRQVSQLPWDSNINCDKSVHPTILPNYSHLIVFSL